MGTHKLRRCRLHDLLIQVLGIKPGTIHIERIPDTGIVNGIRILFTDTGADGIEVFIHFKGLCHHDIHRKMGIERIGQPIHRNRRCGTEIGHIAPGMHTCIRTAAAGYMDIMLHDHGNSFFQGLLDRCQILLGLPTMVRCALIG